MELVVEPDIYAPNIDENGNYVDKVPSFSKIKNGIQCGCGSRKDKVYYCTSYFANHLKTKIHQKWICEINANKQNYFTQNIELNQTINNQKRIIAKLEKENNEHIKTILYLTKKIEQYEHKKNEEIDLLLFD